MARIKIPSDEIIRDYARRYAKALTRLANLGPEYEFDRLASTNLPATSRRADLVAILKDAAGAPMAIHLELGLTTTRFTRCRSCCRWPWRRPGA